MVTVVVSGSTDICGFGSRTVSIHSIVSGGSRAMMSSGIWNDIDMELGLDAPSGKALMAEKFPPATSNSMTESNGADFTTTTSSVPPSSTVYSILSKPIVIAGEKGGGGEIVGSGETKTKSLVITN